MEAAQINKAYATEKKMYVLLNEAYDLTKQLADAVDREDRVTIQMTLAMRREPLKALHDARKSLEQQRDALGDEDARSLTELLNGAAAQRQEEVNLAEQVAKNTRLLNRVLALDKEINLKFNREKSQYHT